MNIADKELSSALSKGFDILGVALIANASIGLLTLLFSENIITRVIGFGIVSGICYLIGVKLILLSKKMKVK